MKNRYVFITESEVFQCIDCGAYAKTEGEVEHYPTCVLGECDRWMKEYSKEDLEVRNEQNRFG